MVVASSSHNTSMAMNLICLSFLETRGRPTFFQAAEECPLFQPYPASGRCGNFFKNMIIPSLSGRPCGTVGKPPNRKQEAWLWLGFATHRLCDVGQVISSLESSFLRCVGSFK